MNKIDRFFREKLYDLVLEPGSGAWVKLDANLSKKNKSLVWFRAAAVFFVIGLLIASIVWLQSGEENPQLAEQLKSELSPNLSSETKFNEDSISQSKNAVKRNSISIAKKTTRPRITPQIIEEPEVEPLSLEAPSNETVALVTSKEKPIVIEYTLESIFPQKKEAPIVAEEKKNGLQKALEFAREAKNSDSPLGGLRHAKDDLFALNFKKDKQKNQ
ncbi:MAG: hypothetical protein AABY93_15775 [Bacteroidota bacterium]